MELLLILSALLTGLTGAFTGDRALGRSQLPTAGVEAAASVGVEQFAEVAVAALQRPIAETADGRRAAPALPVREAARVAVIGASERRLE